MVLMHEDLARAWAATGVPGRDALRWTWFRPAFQAALEAAAATALPSPDEDALAAAFLAWARAAESCEAYAQLDGIDHRHFLAGLLLQHLLAARPPVLGPWNAAQDQPWRVCTGMALTLLQAWRLQAGAPPLVLAPVSSASWRAFREPAAETPAVAIAFLDQLCGLEPDWQTPMLVGSRPAMLRARRAGGAGAAAGRTP